MAVEVSGDRRVSFAGFNEVLPLPNLIQVQLDSFRWFQAEGIRELFQEISPITDFAGKMSLEFIVPEDPFGKPKYSEADARLREVTYSAPLTVKARLVKKVTAEGEPLGEITEQEVFMGDFPLMTEQSTFVINGAERVVVSQLVRSPGVYYSLAPDANGHLLPTATVIPHRGAWLEFEVDQNAVVYVRIDRTRKLPVTVLLRALRYGTDEEILKLYDHDKAIQATLAKDDTKTPDDALLGIYRRLRPGDPPTIESARTLLNTLFFDPRRYDLGRVGRYKLNKKLGFRTEDEGGPHDRVLRPQDIAEIVRYLIALHNGQGKPDDIDHLGNRRVRSVGELLQNQF